MQNVQKQHHDSTLLTREAFAAYLGISLSSLNRLIKSGDITPIKLGKLIRFDKTTSLSATSSDALTIK